MEVGLGRGSGRVEGLPAAAPEAGLGLQSPVPLGSGGRERLGIRSATRVRTVIQNPGRGRGKVKVSGGGSKW